MSAKQVTFKLIDGTSVTMDINDRRQLVYNGKMVNIDVEDDGLILSQGEDVFLVQNHPTSNTDVRVAHRTYRGVTVGRSTYLPLIWGPLALWKPDGTVIVSRANGLVVENAEHLPDLIPGVTFLASSDVKVPATRTDVFTLTEPLFNETFLLPATYLGAGFYPKG